MRYLFLLPLLLAAPVAAAAQAGPTPRIVEVRLTSFDFAPATIRLASAVLVMLKAGSSTVTTEPHSVAVAPSGQVAPADCEKTWLRSVWSPRTGRSALTE